MCTHPLHAFQVGYTDSLKPKYQIMSGDVERIHMPRSTGSRHIWQDLWITNYIEVPCGKCIQCRLSYSRQWATRCVLEAREYKDNKFITLTYDPEHLPFNTSLVDKDTGEIVPTMTLVQKDLQDFFKRLRRYYEYNYGHTGIRFYACGEYGDENGRPHYHAIVFNLPIYDERPFGKTQHGKGFNLTTSDTLSKIWGKGLVGIAEVNWDTCAYTARYIMKKQKGPDAKEYYESIGQVPEFVVMSRKPGIARKYYEENKDKIYSTDEIIIPGAKGVATTFKPSKYYDNLYDIDQDNPFIMQEIKARRRKAASEAMKIKLSKTSLSKSEYLDLVDRKKREQVKRLPRTL